MGAVFVMNVVDSLVRADDVKRAVRNRSGVPVTKPGSPGLTEL